MILFLGTRPGKTETQPLTGVTCPYCQTTGNIIFHSTPNYFHLFWIKIFPVYTSRMAECSHCKKGYYKDEFTEEMRREIES